MNPKIDFGCDYISIMRSMAFKGHPNEVNQISDAAAKLFLALWGFTVDEIAQADQLFYFKMNSGQYNAPLIETAKRVVYHLSANRQDQERLIVQLAALGLMDFVVTDQEKAFVLIFQQLLQLDMAKYQDLCNQGANLAVVLNNFGKVYMDSAINQ